MNIYFDHLSNAKQTYPHLKENTTRENHVEIYQNKKYVQIGKTGEYLDSGRRRIRLIIAIAASCFALLTMGIPLLFQNYRWWIIRSWREYQTSRILFKIYVLESAYTEYKNKQALLTEQINTFHSNWEMDESTMNGIIDIFNTATPQDFSLLLTNLLLEFKKSRNYPGAPTLISKILELGLLSQKMDEFFQYAKPLFLCQCLEFALSSSNTEIASKILDKVLQHEKLPFLISEMATHSSHLLVDCTDLLPPHTIDHILDLLIQNPENESLSNLFFGLTKKVLSTPDDINASDSVLPRLQYIEARQTEKVPFAFHGMVRAFTQYVESETDMDFQYRKFIYAKSELEVSLHTFLPRAKRAIWSYFEIKKEEMVKMLKSGGLFTSPPLCDLMMSVWHSSWSQEDWESLTWKTDLPMLTYLYLAMSPEQQKQTLDVLSHSIPEKQSAAQTRLEAINEIASGYEVILS